MIRSSSVRMPDPAPSDILAASESSLSSWMSSDRRGFRACSVQGVPSREEAAGFMSCTRRSGSTRMIPSSMPFRMASVFDFSDSILSTCMDSNFSSSPAIELNSAAREPSSSEPPPDTLLP